MAALQRAGLCIVPEWEIRTFNSRTCSFQSMVTVEHNINSANCIMDSKYSPSQVLASVLLNVQPGAYNVTMLCLSYVGSILHSCRFI